MKHKALVLFSGGSDSTLAAALYAEQGYEVHLVTLDRFSYVRVKNYTEHNYIKLVSIYGEKCFVRAVLNIEKWHKLLNYENYLHYARKYGLAVVALNFSKLSLHWRALAYAIENEIEVIADGAVPYMRLYLDQNQKISLGGFQELYQQFGIRHESPVWDLAEDVEQLLYDRGINKRPQVRGTDDDRQVFYAEQFVFALFAKYYCAKYGEAAYEKKMAELYSDKFEFIKKETLAWKNGQGKYLPELLS